MLSNQKYIYNRGIIYIYIYVYRRYIIEETTNFSLNFIYFPIESRTLDVNNLSKPSRFVILQYLVWKYPILFFVPDEIRLAIETAGHVRGGVLYLESAR